MNGVDTNILIYRLDRRDPMKRAKARDLLQDLKSRPVETYLLWQVAAELIRHLRTWQDKGQITRATLERYVRIYRGLFKLKLPTPNVLDYALDLANRYSLSHWDSMLLGACLDAQVDTLYTEDMGAPTTIETIRLVNPFI
jgi:predicted nucleic acid-binding protein